MNLTLTELIAIHARFLSRGVMLKSSYSITNIIVQNLLQMNDIGKAESYLRTLFKEEISEAGEFKNKKDIDNWVSGLDAKLKQIVKGLEGVSKPLTYRKYLQDLYKIDFKEYGKMVKEESKTDEHYNLSEVAIKLKRSTKMIRNYIESGKLESIRDKAGKLMIPKRSLDNFQKGFE